MRLNFEPYFTYFPTPPPPPGNNCTVPKKMNVACVASVSLGLSAGLKHFSLLERAKIGASAKKYEKVEGREERKRLPGNPHDFEKPVRPRTEFPDWRGMVVLIAK